MSDHKTIRGPVQDPPNTLQVELTEGCNLYCPFCGIHGIRRGPSQDLRFAMVKAVEDLARQVAALGWSPRIEFAMHGEPTLNQHAEQCVAAFRKALGKRAYILMLSNGGGLAVNGPQRIRSLFAAGLSTLGLEMYRHNRLAPRLREWAMRSGIPCQDYPGAAEGPHSRTPGQRIMFIQDIADATEGTHACLNNHCGAGSPPNVNGHGKRCAKPFRELAVRWDGSIAICCNDWRGVYKVGTVSDGIGKVWNGPALEAARRRLYLGRRDFPPCSVCDALSYRVGLLPDKAGRTCMPQPLSEDDHVISMAVRGAPLTSPVARPWERRPLLPAGPSSHERQHSGTIAEAGEVVDE